MNDFDVLVLVVLLIGMAIGTAITSAFMLLFVDWQWVWDRIADVAGCAS